MNTSLKALSFLSFSFLPVVITGCGSDGGTTASSNPPTPTSGAEAAVPSSPVGRWNLVSVEGTQGQHANTSGVVAQLDLSADGAVAYRGCLAPQFDSQTTLSCHGDIYCATGRYTFDGTSLILTQTDRSDEKKGTISFERAGMALHGNFFGPSLAVSHMHALDELAACQKNLP